MRSIIEQAFVAKVSTIEEPDAGKLHVGVCAGGCRVTDVPTAGRFEE